MKRIILYLLIIFFHQISFGQGTIINRGDFVILAVNANLPAPNTSRDEISFVCFKDITTGTQLQLLDNGYESCQAGLWSGGEGGVLLTRTGGTIPKGTVITFRTDPILFLMPDNGWSVANLYTNTTNTAYSLTQVGLNMNAGGDQIYFAQGGTWTPQSSLCTINGPRTTPNSIFPGNNGRILFGFSTSGSWSSFQQSSGESGLFPGMNCFSMAPTSGTAYNKYTGPLTAATQTDWIKRVSDVNNWTSYSSNNNYNNNGTDYAGGFTIPILSGGDIPTAAWTTPADMCSNAGTINLTSFITGTAGGTFSGTGVSGNNFNPSGLNGTYDITYTITYNNGATSCPITQTNSITVNGTPTQPTLSVTAPNCTTSTGTVTVTSTTSGLTFSNDGVNYTNTTGVFSNIAAGASYSITAKSSAGCTSTAATGTMPAAPTTPAQPTISVTAPTCTVSTGTLSVTSATTGLSFSIDGVNYTNTTGVFANIAAGTSYSITAKNASGCISTAATGTMPAAPNTPTQPTISVTAPTCTVNTGTITVTSSTTGLSFSIDGVNYTNTTGIFTNIASGTSYSITAQNASGCTSVASTGTMPTVPNTPAQPTVSVTPPTCTNNTGTVTVTSTTTGLTFSNDGINYTNTTGIFTNITSGATYSITAKNATGCVSIAATGTMPAAPNTPAQPTVSVTAPTCTVNTGTLTVTSATTGLTFSNDGVNYTNNTGVFANIAAGAAYSITAKNAAGCVSIATTGTMPAAPNTPAQPTLSVTSPTCTVGTGSIAVTSPITGLSFSIDGINYTNSTGTFFNIAGGTSYSITAKNAAGCISTAATGTMPTVPNTPAQPTVSVTAPTCTVNTGTVTVTSSTTGLTFSIDGINYTNSTGVFTNIAANASYSITAKNATGCVSAAAIGTMPASPNTPVQPTVSVTAPTCTVSTGTITVTSSTTGLTFSNDGINYTNSTGVFTNIAANASYSITAKNAAGCISVATTGTIPASPTTPAQPTVSVTAPTCTVNTGTVTVTSSTTGLTFSNDGVNYTNATGIFSNLAANTSYSITAKNGAGCISTAATGTIPTAPNTPIQPTLSITQPTCTVSTGKITVTSTLTGLTFSIDGVNYTNTTGVFSNITAGTAYSVTAKNTSGCISSAATGTIGAALTTPTKPTVAVANPTCSVNTGTLTVTSSTTGLFFSNDGINYTNSIGVFANIAAGSNYSITAKNTDGCISQATTGTIGGLVTAPSKPVVKITDPTCVTGSGSIKVTSTITGLTFSIDGSDYSNTTGEFTNLIPGSTFSITAKNAGGCVSQATSGSIKNLPIIKAPVLTIKNNCGISTITATGVTGTLVWSDGGTGNPRTFVTKTNILTALQTDGVCTSANSNGVIADPIQKTNPPVTTSNTRCQPGPVKLSASGTGSIKWYADEAMTTLLSVGAAYTPNVNQTTTFYATTTISGCESNPVSAVAFINNFTSVQTYSEVTICTNELPYTWNGKKFTAAGNYAVVLSDVNGCDSVTHLSLKVYQTCKEIYFPSAFTPNGDGNNDDFGPLGDINNLLNYSLTVYNRWGEVVFTTTDPLKKWNGKLVNQEVGTGNFVWHASYIYKGNVKTVKGSVTLIR